MKKKQLTEIKNKSVEELEKLVLETKAQLSKLKLEVLSGKNKNKRAGRSLRKEIAQVKTIINEKRLFNVIPAKAGIQVTREKSGSPIRSGMTGGK